MSGEKITVCNMIGASAKKVWGFYVTPEHVKNWNNASDDWHTTAAVNDLRVGGEFSYRMEAKDGSAGFDFAGSYEEIRDGELIQYSLEDDRKVTVKFDDRGENTFVEVIFDAESENSQEMQKAGWQSILDNFKKYVEG